KLPGYNNEQRCEEATKRPVGERLREEHAGLSGRSRSYADEKSCAPLNIPVAVLPPRADDGRGEDREQGRPGGDVLRESQRHERRDEEDAAAHAEHSGEDPGG